MASFEYDDERIQANNQASGLNVRTREKGLQFDDVCVNAGGKRILWSVSGYAVPGRVLAIMGPSGSGKTTLLNTVSGFGRKSSGSVTLHGQKVTDRVRRRVSYVMQNDVFFPNLTLRETLTYTALLRLPRELCVGEKLTKVEHILEKLYLKECANTKIGSFLVRGLSGGEKKRTSIACELLTDPVMLLLDEPTSGLDSTHALQLVKFICSIAKEEDKIVVMSIHQPSSQMFHLFDDLLLMCKGQVAYFGEASNALDYVTGKGLKCTANYNPADFLLEVLKNDDTRRVLINEPEEMTVESQKSPLCICCRKSEISHEESKVEKSVDSGDKAGDIESPTLSITTSRKWPTPWHWQFRVLLWRTFKQSSNTILSRFNSAQMFLLAVIVSLIWFQVPYREENIFDRCSYLYFSLLFWTINSATLSALSIPAEHPVISKEQAGGFYYLSAYYLAKFVVEIPLVLLDPSIYLIMTFWFAGIGGAVTFFGVWVVLIVNCLAAQSLGVMIAAIMMDFQKVVTTTVVVMITYMIIGGFYVTHLPFWLKWAQYGVFVNYSYHSMLQFVFTDKQFQCTQNLSLYEACNVSNGTIPGSDVLKEHNATMPLYQNFFIIFAFGLVFRVLGYFAMKFLHRLKF